MSGAATRTSPRKTTPTRGGRTTLRPKPKASKKRKKVSATTAVKDKRARQPVKTPEVAKGGGQPTVVDVDVGVDTVAKRTVRVSGGKRKTPPELSAEPVKTPQVVAPAVVLKKKRRVGVVNRKTKPSKRNLVVTLPRRLDDDADSEYEEDENEDDENEDDENEDDNNKVHEEVNEEVDDDNDNEDQDEDDEDAVQESITDEDGDEGGLNNTAGGHNKTDSDSSESDDSSTQRFRAILEQGRAADVAAEDEAREVLNRSAQKGTANPPNKHSSSASLLKIGGDIPV